MDAETGNNKRSMDTGPAGLPLEKKFVLEMWCTLNCNENCIFCPTKETSKSFLSKNNFARLAQMYFDQGIRQINLQGGEPTLINDIDRYCEKARSIGYTKIKLDTNGTLLAGNELVKKLKNSGLRHCLVSLHSTDRKTSERITGSSGTFNKTIAGLHRLAENGIPFTVSFVINNLNYKELPDFFLFCNNIFSGADFSVACSFPIPANRAWDNRDLSIPRHSDAAPYLERGLALAKKLDMRVMIPRLSSMPLCVFPKRNLYREYLDVFSPVLIQEINAGKLPVDVSEKKLRGGYKKIYLKICQSCSVRPLCQGIHENYIRLHGDSEITPAP